MTFQIEFSASDDVTKALVELGRTEDVKFSPDNHRLAIAGFIKNKILIVDSCIEETTIRTRVTLSNSITITSPSLQSPHGLCFIDNQTLIVVNRDGEAAILTLPQVSDGESIFELSALQTIHANEAQLLKSPGSVIASRIWLDLYEVLICNNSSHTVTRHILDAREKFRAIRNEILLQKGLAIPDGIAVNPDMSWIAVSNHNTHSVLMFRNDSTLDPSSEPAGILSNLRYPHGVCFTQNNNFVLVADAAAPYVHLYAKTRGDWKGKRDPIASIRTMDDEIFLRGRSNPQEGGPKGLDIANNMTVFVTTCQHQPLAFFDLKKVGIPLTKYDRVILSRGAKCKTDPRRRLPAHVPGDGRLVPNGGRLPRLRSTPALARRVRLPSVRRGRGTLGDGAGRAHVYGVQRGNLADSRHGVPGHPQAVADVVSGDVVHHQPEERGERLGPAASAGPGQLRDGLDLAAQAAQGHGAARARAAHWRNRDRRDLCGWPGRG